MRVGGVLSPVNAPTGGAGFDVGGAIFDRLDGDEEGHVEVEKTLMEYAVDIPEPGVGPLRFEDFPFQEEWYSEEVAQALEVVLRKSAQLGASAWAWRITGRRVDRFGDTAIYTFPTEKHVTEFGDERIEPAIQESPYLRSRIPSRYVHTKHLKRIGRGHLHMKGSNSTAGAQSVAAQMLVFDEYDLLDQVNLAQMERRITGAIQVGKTPRVIRLGYPYNPGGGIDAAYRSSDQRVWHVTCPECGDEQPIVWEVNFRWTMPGDATIYRPGADVEDLLDPKELGEVWRCCRSCSASFEDSAPLARDGALRRGRWIAQNPESKIIGYEAWRGMVPVTGLRQLVIASRGTTEAAREAFYVLDLGRPYVSGETSLDVPTLMRACGLGLPRRVESYTGRNPTTMGVDVGDRKGIHVTIDEQLPAPVEGVLNPRQTLWCGIVKSWDEVAEKMELFRVHMAAIDMNPERRWVRLLRAHFPGRVVGVEYEWNPSAPPFVLESDPAGVPEKVRVYRTDAIDGMMDAVRQVRWRPLQVPPPQWLEQMQALRRKLEIDPKKLRPFWIYEETGNAGADFAHSAVYAMIATELWRTQVGLQAQALQARGHVLPDAEMGFRRLRLGMDAELGG